MMRLLRMLWLSKTWYSITTGVIRHPSTCKRSLQLQLLPKIPSSNLRFRLIASGMLFIPGMITVTGQRTKLSLRRKRKLYSLQASQHGRQQVD
jgi:hypothetical protein